MPRHAPAATGLLPVRDPTEPLKFRLTSLGGATAETFEVRDAKGQVLTTTERRPGVQSLHHRVPLRAASSYEVDERAALLVLFADGREVRRLPLQLRPGDVTDVGY